MDTNDKPSAKRHRPSSSDDGKSSANLSKFSRGIPIATKQITDKKLKGKLRHTERLAKSAQLAAAKIDQWLLPEEAGALEAEGLESTWQFQQQDIVGHLEEGAAKKVIDLSLTDLGPYKLDFTRSGRFMLLGGRRGHLALMDWQRLRLTAEVQVQETVRDVSFLHNETFFAAAQRKYVYIYDKRGIEIHCLKEHTDVNRLDFLPHHFLLTSVGSSGVLRYQDTSTGALVAQHRTRLGPCSVMTHNPWNAVMCLGHANGTVTMWTPNITTPAVRMLCHRGPVTSVSVDPQGNHMVTTGRDGEIKVWDIRTYRAMHSYYSPAPCEWSDISQQGLLAVGYGRRVQIWSKDALQTKVEAPYMNHTVQNGVLCDLKFCPFEDVLGIGHSGGGSTIVVPGAGEPNFDSYVADPFQTKSARKEHEVHLLMDKLQPEMIVLDPSTIGQVAREPTEVQRERKIEEAAANAVRKKAELAKSDEKTKMKGRNKPTRRRRKKEMNIIEEKKPAMKERMRKEVEEKKERAARSKEIDGVPRALHAFYRK
jgi:U3 small nucleolar RNA-associated protein 7